MISILESFMIFSVFYREKKNFNLEYYYAREGYKFSDYCLSYTDVI